MLGETWFDSKKSVEYEQLSLLDPEWVSRRAVAAFSSGSVFSSAVKTFGHQATSHIYKTSCAPKLLLFTIGVASKTVLRHTSDVTL